MRKNILKRTLSYLESNIVIIILTIILAIITVMLSLYVPILFGQAIDVVVGKNNVDFENLKVILLKIMITICLYGALQWVMMSLNNNVAYKMCKKLRTLAFLKIQKLPLKYLDAHPYGEVLSIIVNDVDQFSDGLLLGLTQIFTGLATIVGTIIIMCIINVVIAVVVIIVTPLSLFVAKFIATKTYNLFKEQNQIKAEQTSIVDEMVGNLKVVKAFNYEQRALVRFDEINERLSRCSLKAIFYSSLTNPCTRFVNSVVYAMVALVGSLIAVGAIFPQMVITAGTLTTFLSYANQYTKPFNEISSVITEFQNALSSASRVYQLLDENEEVSDVNNLKLGKVNGNIDLNNVYFAYDPNQKLIQDFNLHVKSGQKIAIVGPTGCGKTTLINLLMRFYDVNDGNILVEGINVKDLTRHSLRNNYGMVLQDTWIKHASVKENIALGKENATFEEIVNACKRAHADSFIRRLPQGYDTILKDDASLSVGERQLLCIARIMLCLPPMLILDEATSSIDTRTELKIQKAFDTLMEGKTTFIVAHRLSTIKEADIILVMNNGNIIEQGTHEQLLKKNGFYANLYNSQFVKY